jgi:hypothetical protein
MLKAPCQDKYILCHDPILDTSSPPYAASLLYGGLYHVEHLAVGAYFRA